MGDLIFFLRLMGRHKGWMVLGGLLTLITLTASIVLLSVAGWFITASAVAGIGGAGALLVFNYVTPSAAIRAAAVTRILSRYGERITTHEATFRILARVRCWFFAKALPLSPSQLAGMRSGDMLNRMTSDIDALDTLYLRILVPTLVALITAVAVTALIGQIAPTIALAVAGLLAFAGILVPFWAARQGRPMGTAIAVETAATRSVLVDAVQGLADLICGRADTARRDDIHASMGRLLDERRSVGRLRGFTSALTGLTADAAIVVVLVLALPLLAQGDLNGPAVALMAFCALASFEAVAPLALAFQDLGRTREAARRLLGVARARPSVVDPSPDEEAYPPGRNDLRLEAVTFSYPAMAGEEERTRPRPPAIERVTLSISAGRKVALVGPSGGGKSTILALLMRLYDPDLGKVYLGGIDVRRLPQADLWARIGFLSQHTELFSASIRGNILLGRPDASDSDVWDAVRAAGLEEFVRAQPMGLDTWVGETGAQVSGGEARRIALARVLLKNPPVLLLDEPTEGLDRDTAEDVMKALNRLSDGKTVVMVTHRGGFLEGMREIWLVEQGRLVTAERPGPSGKAK